MKRGVLLELVPKRWAWHVAPLPLVCAVHSTTACTGTACRARTSGTGSKALLVDLVMVGCGGDKAAPTQEPTPPPAETPAPTHTPQPVAVAQ